MGNCNREIRVGGKHPLTDMHERVLLYDVSFLRNLRIFKSENRNYFYTLPDGRKGITWPFDDWRICVLIPVPLACEASALPFELIPLAEVPPLY